MRMKVSDYIAKKLVQEGISDVFMITGGGAMHLDDGLGHEPGLHCYFNHHEQACAIAAECYARIHNKIAAVCVTTGPGGTNAITGVVGGWLDSIPMLILSGQVRYDTTAHSTGLAIRAMGDQEFEITKAVSCMTKYCEMVLDPMRIRFCLEKALYLAQTGRPGPCWLDIPLNVQGAYVETENLLGFDAADYAAGGTGWSAHGTGCQSCTVCMMNQIEGKPAMIPEDVKGQGERREPLPEPVTVETARQILRKVREAKRPVINAGNGIRIGKAYEVFARVVDKLGIPVVTGWNSIDCMYDTHPLYVGRAGHMGDRPGNFAVQNSDLLLSLGSRLSIRQVGYNYKTWAREAYVIYNDIDSEELKKPTLHVDMPVHADVKDLLEKLELVLDEEEFDENGGPKDPQATVERCVALPGMEGKISGGASQALRGRRRGACQHLRGDQGNQQPGRGKPDHGGRKRLSLRGGRTCLCNEEGTAVYQQFGHCFHGYDLPAAIGAWVADHTKDIILVTGDGSIQMNLQELQTIIHHKMDIKIFLINNGGYHSIRQTQRTHFKPPFVGIGVDSHDLSFPSMEKLAWAYGYPYVSAHHNSELGEAVEKTLATEGPVICEIFVDTVQSFEPKAEAKMMPDGTMVSVPLEDLAPFLPDEELKENMIVPMVKNE